MTFLPIVERELRLAARRRNTRRIRWWTAVIALLGGGFAFLFIGLAGGPARGGSGVLFTVLTGYAFLLCMLTGVLLTSDCLSQEKREGTLGLLFLTDLHGYDVVLGKFIATSLNAFYGLLALLPVMALPLLLGGVTGAEFWRTALALVNALFFSLAAGICISAFSRVSERALLNSLALVLLVTAGLPMLAMFLPRLGVGQGWSACAWLSPFAAFRSARQSFAGAGPSRFFEVLLVSHSLGWLLLGLASYALPHLWQEGAARRLGFSSRNRSRATLRPCRVRRVALDPVLWVMGDEPALQRTTWVVVAAWAAAVGVIGWYSRTDLGPLVWVWKVCGFVLKMLVAFQACRFFVEARRSSALELLLCTPLRSQDIVRGQWLAMKRLVFWPVVVCALLGLAPFALESVGNLAHPAPGPMAMAFVGLLGGLLTVGWFGLGLVADIWAVTWVGMWLALSSKRPELAPVRTIFFVLVLPSVAICGTDLLVDLLLVLWSANRLQQDFRWVLAQPSRK